MAMLSKKCEQSVGINGAEHRTQKCDALGWCPLAGIFNRFGKSP